MTRDDARTLVIDLLGEVAPDADLAALDDDADLQESLDLDSMDLMTLVTAASEATGRDIPDQDARRLRTLGAWADELATA